MNRYSAVPDPLQVAPEAGWRGPLKPVIEPAPRGTGRLRRYFVGLLGSGHGVRATNLFLTLSRHPLLFFPWLIYASRLMPYGRLDRCDVERVILRVAWLTRCHYEWNQHVVIGRQAGLTDAEILAVTEGPEAARDARIEILLRACDEVVLDGMLSIATHRSLMPWFDEKSRIELLFLVGQYQMLAGVIHGLGVQIESDADVAVS